jgi:uncharacterized protein DUF5670
VSWWTASPRRDRVRRSDGRIRCCVVLNGTARLALTRYAEDEGTMLQTLAVILIILWLLGTVSSYTMGGFIHVFLVVGIVMLLFRFIQGRRIA